MLLGWSSAEAEAQGRAWVYSIKVGPVGGIVYLDNLVYWRLFPLDRGRGRPHPATTTRPV